MEVANPMAEAAVATVVVGLVGMSCSGKSTAAARLSAELNGKEVQVLCQDDHFNFEQYRTDGCPRRDIGARAWKDWETSESMKWPDFVDAIKDAKLRSTSPYLVVEGFQLCAHADTLSLLNAVVALDLSKAECWQRRKGRALSMRHLPPGLGDDMNYEVLETYTFGESPETKLAAQDAIRAAAAVSDICAQEGDDAWLRLYFEEMVWPEAERQREDVARVRERGIPVLDLDCSEPSGKEEWLERRMPEAAAFVRDVGAARPREL